MGDPVTGTDATLVHDGGVRDLFHDLIDRLEHVLPFLVVVAVFALGLVVLRLLLHRGKMGTHERKVTRQTIFAAACCGTVVALIVAVPNEELRHDLLSLLGVLLMAVVALSSTTIVSNIMAGLMLRMVRNFRQGDFLRAGEHFGRVTERGVFHVEIQTLDRDLVTIPNAVMITQPVSVVHSSGTIVAATLSIGYDVPHTTLKPLLLEAAEYAGLEDGYVLVEELNDFSVTYRVAGFLVDVRTLISARSRLNQCVLDTLHASGIEIMSPAYMVQRRVDPGTVAIPPDAADIDPSQAVEVGTASAEIVAFDKADHAAALEDLREERNRLEQELAELKKSDQDPEGARAAIMEARIVSMRERITGLEATLQAADEGD